MTRYVISQVNIINTIGMKKMNVAGYFDEFIPNLSISNNFWTCIPLEGSNFSYPRGKVEGEKTP